MFVLKIKENNSKSIVRLTGKSIKGGKVIVFPTDTVYGLIADAANKKAVEKIFKMKKRAKEKPLPIFVKDIKMAKKFAYINKDQVDFLKKSWPGKITAVLKRKPSKTKIYGLDEKTIALRVPKYKLITELFKRTNFPLAETSVNISNQPPITEIKEIVKHFKKIKLQPDLIIDAGNLKPSKPSTVIDLTQKKPKILRE